MTKLIIRFFLFVSIAGLILLIVSDISHHFTLSSLHNHLDSVPLISIGISFILLNISAKIKQVEKVKGIFLGIAFLLWGGEQLVPQSSITTIMDEGAVGIFVIDVSLMILDRLKS